MGDILLGLGSDSDVNGTRTTNANEIMYTDGGYTSTGAGNASSFHFLQGGQSFGDDVRVAVYSGAGALLVEAGPITVDPAQEYSVAIDLDIDDATVYILCLLSDGSFKPSQDTGTGKTLHREAYTYGAYPSNLGVEDNTASTELAMWLEGTEGGSSPLALIRQQM